MADIPIITNPILRRTQVQAATGYSRSTIYVYIAKRLWPRPVSLGARAVGWPASEVAALNAARIAGKTEDQIRTLVQQLEDGRVACYPSQYLLPTQASREQHQPRGRSPLDSEA